MADFSFYHSFLLKFSSIHIAVDVFQDSRDPEAFNAIYKMLSPKLYYVCLRYLKNDADAQDALQETFVTAYRKIDSFLGQGSFEGWIRRIAVNTCLSKLRIDKKQFEQEDYNLDKAQILSEEEEYLQKEETEAKLLRALKELPDGYRTIINLAILEDYSHREIGELLNITESTSRSQLSRAKAALKLKLEHE
ncbi:RNA polymerase sigma factor [Fluviicola taffensis]|uniref:RNA polymerase, sigma-24 subunit, ECF subfamily n=1 Tax=Fluviicola taffensis (strain DSM 16823 / NCIMB 13979 / RW262) TaxID=755732 RepID=F2II80_FLUTR|nr:RNA polymerase sigma factor [Fluviicola taffensis]AEA43789.1 RNA polymerase, sigma-24 subunit, ECF subfamily [Fluviicola taffensis DSM 16823]